MRAVPVLSITEAALAAIYAQPAPFAPRLTAMASASTPPAQHEAPNPPSANPPSQGESAGLSVLRSPGSSDAQQTTPSRAVDLSDEERLTLGALLTRTISNDRYPSSLRVHTLKDILTKLDAKSP